MIRASALTGRFRRSRREAPGLAGRDASPLLAAPVAAPEVKTGTRPYADGIPVSQVTAYRLAAASEFFVPRPGFEPAAGRAPETAPMPVAAAVSDPAERERQEIIAAYAACETAENGTGALCMCSFDCANYCLRARGHGQADSAEAPGGTLDMPEVLALRRLLDGIKGIDGKALDAAKAQEGLTYARTIGAPFHNALLAGWRSPVRPVRRHGQAVTAKAKSLKYPEFSLAVVAGEGAYAGVMEHANRITGTLGTGLFRPALTAGGAA